MKSANLSATRAAQQKSTLSRLHFALVASWVMGATGDSARDKAVSKRLCCGGRFYNFLQSFAMP
jgi:hypothetical protein